MPLRPAWVVLIVMTVGSLGTPGAAAALPILPPPSISAPLPLSEPAPVTTVIDVTSAAVQVDARYEPTRLGGHVALTLTLRPGASVATHVSIPFGTVTRGGRSLLLLEARRLLLAPGRVRRLSLRAAWVDLSGPPPSATTPLRLTHQPGLARLAQAAAQAGPRHEAAAQLAVWILNTNLERAALLNTSEGPRLSCTSRKLVHPVHAGGAARLLRSAGASPRRLRFYRAALPRLSSLIRAPEVQRRPGSKAVVSTTATERASPRCTSGPLSQRGGADTSRPAS